ncbi:unnamed protein product [Schistocephalus solidus]|uniref:Secreted protein n=1 Tax=Schistocephalus solidus TaxID=70667 RepID=A0A183SVM8_SCHSO|nr:unnamed protein product [Schistocephalus solidus]
MLITLIICHSLPCACWAACLAACQAACLAACQAACLAACQACIMQQLESPSPAPLTGSTALSPRPPPEPDVKTESRRPEMGEGAGGWTAGAAPGRATTPGSVPTEWGCHKDHMVGSPKP